MIFILRIEEFIDFNLNNLNPAINENQTEKTKELPLIAKSNFIKSIREKIQNIYSTIDTDKKSLPIFFYKFVYFYIISIYLKKK